MKPLVFLKKIRIKILLGFSVLILVLLSAAIFSIYELKNASKKVQQLVDNNYKTILACESMNDAIEMQNNSIIILFINDNHTNRKIIYKSDSLFEASLNIAKNNITETDEDKYVYSVDSCYTKLKQLNNKVLKSRSLEKDSLSFYFKETYPTITSLKIHIRSLSSLNELSMYKSAMDIKSKSRRIAMPSIIAVISSLVLLILLNFFINYYFVTPFEKIIKAINNISPYESKFSAGIKSEDEFKRLEEAIDNLIHRINDRKL